MDGELPFLNDEALPEAEEQAQEPVAVEPVEAKGEKSAAPPVAQEELKQIPISALLDEREKRQAATRELEELKRQLAAREQQQKPVDFYEDPEQRLAFERAQIDHKMWNQHLNTSEMIARNAHGDEAVDAARDAFMAEAQRNPVLRVELMRQPNPYGFVVSWHKKQSVLSKLGDDPDAYIQAEVQRRLQELQAAPKPAAPPASLAAAPSASTGQPVTKSGFEALFGG